MAVLQTIIAILAAVTALSGPAPGSASDAPAPRVCATPVDSITPTSSDGVQYVQVFHWIAIAAPNELLCLRDSAGVVTGEYLFTWPTRPAQMPRSAWQRIETTIDTAYVRPGICETPERRGGMTVCRVRFAELPDWSKVWKWLDVPQLQLTAPDTLRGLDGVGNTVTIATASEVHQFTCYLVTGASDQCTKANSTLRAVREHLHSRMSRR